MVSKKISETIEKSRIEKKGIDPSRQGSQVVDQTSTGQRKETRKSNIKQGKENIPNVV